jgi:hypothetical protein
MIWHCDKLMAPLNKQMYLVNIVCTTPSLRFFRWVIWLDSCGVVSRRAKYSILQVVVDVAATIRKKRKCGGKH